MNAESRFIIDGSSVWPSFDLTSVVNSVCLLVIVIVSLLSRLVI